MKKLILLVLSVSALASSLPYAVYAAQDSETVQTQEQTAAEKTPQVFTIDDAVKYALENNKNLIALNETLTANEYALKGENQSYKYYRDNAIPSSAIGTYYIAVGYQVETAKYQIRKSKRDIVQNEYNIKMAVEKAFYEYLNKLKKIDIAKSNLENAKEKFNQAKVKNAQGTLSDLELSQFEVNVMSGENTLKSENRELEVYMLNLKNTIGYPLDEELKISGEFKLPEMDKTTPEQAVEKSLTNVNMVELRDSYDLAALNYKVNINWYSGAQPQYYNAKATYEAATQQYNQSVNQNTISVITAYNNMAAAYDGVDYMQKQLEVTRKNIDAQKVRYDMGMITASDYIDGVNQLAELEINAADTSLSAYLAALNYRAAYNCTDTSDTGEKVADNTDNKYPTKIGNM